LEQVITRYKPIRISVILFIALLFIVCATPTLAYVGLGGFISEKLANMQGIASSSLVVSRTGNGLTVTGLAPVITTGEATGIDFFFETSATLHGTINNMNSFPTSTAYFDWGYSPACGTSSSAVIMTTAGVYQATITGFDPTVTVYYRGAVNADGTNYGEVRSFESLSGKAIATKLLWYSIPIVIAAGIIIALLTCGMSPIVTITIVAVGLVCYLVAQAILNLLF